MYAATVTPAAGPDSMICTGIRRAVSKVHTPPLDCMTYNPPWRPRLRSFASTRPRYVLTTGAMAAFTTVVLARRYSRKAGDTSEEATIGTPGSSRPRISAASRSWTGLR